MKGTRQTSRICSYVAYTLSALMLVFAFLSVSTVLKSGIMQVGDFKNLFILPFAKEGYSEAIASHVALGSFFFVITIVFGIVLGVLLPLHREGKKYIPEVIAIVVSGLVATYAIYYHSLVTLYIPQGGDATKLCGDFFFAVRWVAYVTVAIEVLCFIFVVISLATSSGALKKNAPEYISAQAEKKAINEARRAKALEQRRIDDEKREIAYEKALAKKEAQKIENEKIRLAKLEEAISIRKRLDAQEQEYLDKSMRAKEEKIMAYYEAKKIEAEKQAEIERKLAEERQKLIEKEALRRAQERKDRLDKKVALAKEREEAIAEMQRQKLELSKKEEAERLALAKKRAAERAERDRLIEEKREAARKEAIELAKKKEQARKEEEKKREALRLAQIKAREEAKAANRAKKIEEAKQREAKKKAEYELKVAQERKRQEEIKKEKALNEARAKAEHDRKVLLAKRREEQIKEAKEKREAARAEMQKAINEKKAELKKVEKKEDNTTFKVYHVLPYENGKEWHLRKMGENKIMKSTKTQKEMIDYVKETFKGKKDVRIFVHDVEGKFYRFL